MRHGSLFSGIGGFDLAAAWAGWTNIFQVEIDPFCRMILKHHFRETHIYEDIKTFNARQYHKAIDIISGGFPCQPFSFAGQRLGSADDRYLWPQMLRVIDAIRPTWVVGENVAGIVSLVQPGVQVNMGTQTTLLQEDQAILTEHQFLIETICQDFERIGYSIQPLIIPACGVGASHRRNRVWFIAYNERRSKTDPRQTGKENPQSNRAPNTPENEIGSSPNSHGKRQQVLGKILGKGDKAENSNRKTDWFIDVSRWPTQSPVCLRDDGISDRLANISFSKWRKKSIHALGNAIVPQVAYQIFTAIDWAT